MRRSPADSANRALAALGKLQHIPGFPITTQRPYPSSAATWLGCSTTTLERPEASADSWDTTECGFAHEM